MHRSTYCPGSACPSPGGARPGTTRCLAAGGSARNWPPRRTRSGLSRHATAATAIRSVSSRAGEIREAAQPKAGKVKEGARTAVHDLEEVLQALDLLALRTRARCTCRVDTTSRAQPRVCAAAQEGSEGLTNTLRSLATARPSRSYRSLVSPRGSRTVVSGRLRLLRAALRSSGAPACLAQLSTTGRSASGPLRGGLSAPGTCRELGRRLGLLRATGFCLQSPAARGDGGSSVGTALDATGEREFVRRWSPRSQDHRPHCGHGSSSAS